jgi:hypothetical protein
MSHINLVHRKLLYLYFFLLACTFLFSQIPNGITTSVGNQSNLSICDGDLVTFTLDPVSGTAQGYVFYRIRGGVHQIVQYNSASNIFSTTFINDGDIFYGAYEFNLNPFERVFFPKYSFLLAYGSLTKIGNSYRMFLSQELQLGEFSVGVNQQFSYLKNFSMNNFGISVGLSLENFDIGLIYDFGVKNVDKVFAPSVFELYLTFDFSKFRRNNRGLFKRLQTDNYF